MEIDTRLFFKIGIVVYIIIGLCAIANFFIFFALNNIWSNISQIAGIAFNITLVLFFIFLLKNTPKTAEEGYRELDHIEDIVKEFKNERKKQRR
jgi:Ca2+/Na+ antiporter